MQVKAVWLLCHILVGAVLCKTPHFATLEGRRLLPNPSGFYGDVLLPGYQALRNESLEARHAWQTEQVLRIGFREAKRLGDRCIIARHEDLLGDPVAHLSRITDFIGATTRGLPVDAVRRRRSSGEDLWKGGFPAPGPRN